MKKLSLLLLFIIAASASAQTIAAQRAQHNASACGSALLPSSCTDADMIVAACGGVPDPSLQAQYDACLAARTHVQKIYTADAAWRNADDLENQRVRLVREKQVFAERVQWLSGVVLRRGGANCVSLLNLLGVADTSICSK